MIHRSQSAHTPSIGVRPEAGGLFRHATIGGPGEAPRSTPLEQKPLPALPEAKAPERRLKPLPALPAADAPERPVSALLPPCPQPQQRRKPVATRPTDSWLKPPVPRRAAMRPALSRIPSEQEAAAPYAL